MNHKRRPGSGECQQNMLDDHAVGYESMLSRPESRGANDDRLFGVSSPPAVNTRVRDHLAGKPPSIELRFAKVFGSCVVPYDRGTISLNSRRGLRN